MNIYFHLRLICLLLLGGIFSTCAVKSLRENTSQLPSPKAITMNDSKAATLTERAPEVFKPSFLLIWELDGSKNFIQVHIDEKKSEVGVMHELIVTNLTTKKILFRGAGGDQIESISKDETIDSTHPMLVTTWSGGNSHSIRIFRVNKESAEVVFDKSYLALGSARLINLDLSKLGVLLSTAEFSSGPYFTTLYLWDGKEFQLQGTAESEKWANAAIKLFSKKINPPDQ